MGKHFETMPFSGSLHNFWRKECQNSGKDNMNETNINQRTERKQEDLSRFIIWTKLSIASF
jgi:hypothetical protein